MTISKGSVKLESLATLKDKKKLVKEILSTLNMEVLFNVTLFYNLLCASVEKKYGYCLWRQPVCLVENINVNLCPTLDNLTAPCIERFCVNYHNKDEVDELGKKYSDTFSHLQCKYKNLSKCLFIWHNFLSFSVMTAIKKLLDEGWVKKGSTIFSHAKIKKDVFCGTYKKKFGVCNWRQPECRLANFDVRRCLILEEEPSPCFEHTCVHLTSTKQLEEDLKKWTDYSIQESKFFN